MYVRIYVCIRVLWYIHIYVYSKHISWYDVVYVMIYIYIYIYIYMYIYVWHIISYHIISYHRFDMMHYCTIYYTVQSTIPHSWYCTTYYTTALILYVSYYLSTITCNPLHNLLYNTCDAAQHTTVRAACHTTCLVLRCATPCCAVLYSALLRSAMLCHDMTWHTTHISPRSPLLVQWYTILNYTKLL